jgi:hypothetical protein
LLVPPDHEVFRAAEPWLAHLPDAIRRWGRLDSASSPSLDDRFHETAQFSFPGLSGKMLEFREPNMIRILEALV